MVLADRVSSLEVTVPEKQDICIEFLQIRLWLILIQSYGDLSLININPGYLSCERPGFESLIAIRQIFSITEEHPLQPALLVQSDHSSGGICLNSKTVDRLIDLLKVADHDIGFGPAIHADGLASDPSVHRKFPGRLDKIFPVIRLNDAHERIVQDGRCIFRMADEVFDQKFFGSGMVIGISYVQI